MEPSRPSPRYAGFASAFLLPVALPPDAAAPGPALQEARLLTDADPQVASALLRRLLFEAETDGADEDTLAVLHLSAGVAALRGCDPAAAVRHAEASVTRPPLEHPARLCRLAAWVELGLPGDTADRAPGEIDQLLGGPLAAEARVALVTVEAMRGSTQGARRAVAALDAEALPTGLRFLHLVNAGVVLLEANDVAGAFARFAAADALRRAAAATPRERAVVALNRGITVGVQALRGRPDAERAALLAEAVRLLNGAVATLERLGSQSRLLGDCLRNRGVIGLWSGSLRRDAGGLEAALRDHWAALGHYDRPPHWRRQVADQWRNLGLCYRARRGPGDDRRAQACFDRAEAMLGTGHARALAERDLAEAALVLDTDAAAALALSLPASLYLDAQRFRLAGAEARSRWADGAAEDALDDALAAAEASGRGDLAAALVVWRRFGGATQFEHEGPLPARGPDASVLTPPPRIRGVSHALEPYLAEASRRYGVPASELVGPATIDLLGLTDETAG